MPCLDLIMKHDSRETQRGDRGSDRSHISSGKRNCSHIVALSLEDVKEQSDAVLSGGHQLPDAVLVWGVLSGPSWTGDGAVQFGDEASTGGWTEDEKQEETRQVLNCLLPGKIR